MYGLPKRSADFMTAAWSRRHEFLLHESTVGCILEMLSFSKQLS